MKFWTGAGGLSKSRVFPSSLPARYPSVVEEAKLADELGFDAITCPEHHMMYDGFVTTPLQVLAAAAAVTTNIKFIPGAMLQPLYDPLEAAERKKIKQEAIARAAEREKRRKDINEKKPKEKPPEDFYFSP